MPISRRSSVLSRWAVPLLLLSITTLALAQKAAPLPAGPRQQVMLTGEGWKFFAPAAAEPLPTLATPEFTKASWQDVSVPHVFETRQHYETPTQAWYKRDITVPASWAGQRIYVVFEGVTSVADVYVNDQKMGQHRGAYTRFLFDITDAVHVGTDNHLAVRVDNRVEEIKDLLPNKTRLYKLWGGINRKVWLLATAPAGIDPMDFASPGVFITPVKVSPASADLRVEVLLRNTTSSAAELTTSATLLDPSGKPVQTLTAKPTSLATKERTSVTLTGTVANPKLWAPGTPEVYHVRVEVMRAGKVIDAVTQPTGFRTVEFLWKDNIALVNGKRLKLFGSDVHQEIEGKGNALSGAELMQSFDLMSDLGVNFMRLPHYPHGELEYDQCDLRGILCWPEDSHTNDEVWGPTGEQIVTEMVKQNYNHPSLALWSVGNESLPATAEAAVPLVRKLDPTRPVVVANMRCATCDFRTANSYPGWYGGGKIGIRQFTPEGFITEIGAGGVVTTHTDYNQADYKVDSFEPEEYQQLVAESHFSKAFDPANDKLAMFLWWTLRDFSDTKYKKPVGINTKGLTTYAGDKKDIYYLYRSYLRPTEPTLHITSQRYFLRRGAATNGIKVYSNAKAVTLRLNGQVVSTLANGQYTQPDGPYLLHETKTDAGPPPAPKVANVFYWPVALQSGKNVVTATDGLGHTDSATVYYYPAGASAPAPAKGSPIASLTSSNAANPAYWMDMPVAAQWPIYSDLDGAADNSWATLPAQLAGASWIALRRVTKADMATTVDLTLARPSTIYLAASVSAGTADSLSAASFMPVGATFEWRDNAIMLVPAQLYARKVAAGEKVSVTLGDRDAILLLK